MSDSLRLLRKFLTQRYRPAPKETKEPKGSSGGATDGATEAAEGATDAVTNAAETGLGGKPPLALTKKAAEDVAGSLKVHIKIALEIDIQITARIKGVSAPSHPVGGISTSANTMIGYCHRNLQVSPPRLQADANRI